jgi:hypothetical protein
VQLEKILPYLLYEFKSESELIRAVEELSVKFTTQRENINDYLQDQRLVSAYAAFYLTTNYPKFEEVLKWLPSPWLEELKSCDFVDIGAGPGTFSLAFETWRAGGKGKIFQLESSKMMKDQARRLWEGLNGDIPIQQLSSPVAAPKSFVLFGHSANEMGAKEALRYIDQIQPDHILFIEPGIKSFFPEMLQLRKSLIEKGFNLIFPCPHSGTCPLEGSQNDWCHQFIHVQHSPDVERLTQMVKKDRRLLPLTVAAFSKSFKHQDKERIVRVHPATKFSFEWDICLGEKIERYQVFRRGLDKKSQKDFDQVLAGSSLETQTDKVLENGRRVKVQKINNQIIDS